MSNKKNIIWISAISVCLVAILVALCLGITTAWFVAQRRAEGTLEFVDGIKIEYTNMYADEENPANKNLKLAYVANETLYPLEVSDVTGEKFVIANPSLKAKEGTVAYYVRVKLNINLYYNDGEDEVLIDNSTRAAFLQTTEGYTRNGQTVNIENEADLFVNLPGLDNSKFVYLDGWYYLAEANGAVNDLDDLTLTECSYKGQQTETLKLLKENLNGEVVLQLDNSIDYGENMPFTKMTISLDIEAVETAATSVWNS